MKNMKRLTALTLSMVMIAGQIQGQDRNESAGNAYWDSETAAYVAAAVPIGAVVIAAIIIACTRGNHHHSGSVSVASPASVSTPSAPSSASSGS